MDCWYDQYPVRLSDSGISHLLVYDIEPQPLCDMIHDPIDCPKTRKHRRSSTEICSRRKGNTFRIILDLDYTHDIQDYAYIVTHLKPA